MKAKSRENQIDQRQRLKVTDEVMAKRVNDSPFGEKTKAWLRKWQEFESFGNIGWALFDAPPVMERGKGAYLYDADGKRYLDLLSGFSVSTLGECNEAITKIISEQAATLTHYFDLPHPQRITLAEKLCRHSRISGKTKVVFGVTGADATELAVRAARYYTGQPYVLSAFGDYHGVTYGTMGLTGKGGMQEFFHPILPDTAVGHFPFPHEYRSPTDKYPGTGMECIRTLEGLLKGKESPYGDGMHGVNNVAAILVEPFQSSAGYYIPPKEYLQELRRLADEHGILLIVDEIQTGLARSGKLWAFEHSGIEPDMILTSKALGGGLPLAAVIAREEILKEWAPGAHVSTQAGNVLACAAGNYVLDTVSSPEFLKSVNEKGEYFQAGLDELRKKHKIIGCVDRRGLYTGIELVRDRATKEPADKEAVYVRESCVAEGLVFEKGGYYHNRMQLIPPLTIERSELDEVLAIFDKVFGAAEKQFGIG